MTATVCVAVVGDRATADLMTGMLRAHGIKAAVSTDDAGGVEVALQAQGVRVLVASADAAAARKLLDEPAATKRPLNGFQRWVVRLLGGRPD
jgi:hypothetical protein